MELEVCVAHSILNCEVISEIHVLISLNKITAFLIITGEKPFYCPVDDCKRRFTHANRHCPEHPKGTLRRYITPPDKEKGINSNIENENCTTPTKATSAKKSGGIFTEKNSSDEEAWFANK